MKKIFFSIQLFFFSVPIILAQEIIHENPFEVKFYTSDIDHFWEAYDLSTGKTHEEKVAIFEEHYFQKGSLGLQEFKEEKIESAEKLVEAIEAYPDFYKSILKFWNPTAASKTLMVYSSISSITFCMSRNCLKSNILLLSNNY